MLKQPIKNIHGFTLLEAIVALAIMALAGGAILAWVNTLLISLSRIEANEHRNYAIEQSIAVLESVNPMESPTGEQRFGDYQMLWNAKLLEPPKEAVNRFGIQGLFQVGLYQ